MSDYIYTNGRLYNLDDLQHHGIKGQKWGIRRYQNWDGSLTPAGKKRVRKTLKKYFNSKDSRDRLGQVVGEDPTITKAASKLYPARKKYDDAVSQKLAVVSKMEQESQSSNISKQVWKKYKKEYDKATIQEEESRAAYDRASKRVTDEYLGKYGETKITKEGITAGRALVTQIEWGIALGRLDVKPVPIFRRPPEVEKKIEAIAAKYKKKIAAAKSKDEEALIELEWLEELDREGF